MQGPGAARINAGLRAAILRDQADYAESARVAVARDGARRLRSGIYQTTFSRRLISASTVVVSALIPTLELYPGGNDGEGWISVTIDARTGRAVTLADVVDTSRASLRSLAGVVRARSAQTNICVRHALRDPLLAPQFAKSLAPVASNFALFAFTRSGLTFGFDNGSITGPACGRIAVTVPYARVRSLLTATGKGLRLGVR